MNATATMSAPARKASSHDIARDKFTRFREDLSSSLIERDEEVDMCLTALIAGEHVLFVGPPGLGKSLLADRLCDWMDFAADPFSIILSKFTEPDELFGPIGLQSYKEGTHERITTGMLPEASVAFVDECFNGSSAILNTLLPVMNERRFKNGHAFQSCPLELMIGATNQYPGGEGSKELGALFDRFMLRKTVRPIQTRVGLDRLLWGDINLKLRDTATESDIQSARAGASATGWEPDAREAFEEIVHECKRSGILPGDRRIRKCSQLMRAYAWLEGEDDVTTDQLGMLTNCLWVDPAEQPREVTSIVAKVAAPSGLVVNGLLMEVEQIMSGGDLKALKGQMTAIKKLGEICRKFKKIPGEKAEQALKDVSEIRADIKAKSFELMED